MTKDKKPARTATEWLSLPEPDRGVALAEVLTPGPWKHEWDTCGQNAHNKCQKCGKAWASSSNAIKRNFSCPVPDPIVIDWNTAMEWRDMKIKAIIEYGTFYDVCAAAVEEEAITMHRVCTWFLIHAQPYHYLVAAAMAQEAK